MTTNENEDESDPVVLIVEDEKPLSDLYEAYLEESYEVRKAYSADEALDKLDRDIDVVLLDRMLGDWSGSKLLPVIHQRRIDCKVAMVTAVSPDFDIVDLPIDAYLEKPIDQDELVDTVEELLLWKSTNVTHQELLALISRRIVLEETKTTTELEQSEEYGRLERRIEIATDRLHPTISKTSSKYRPSACPSCKLSWDHVVEDTSGYVVLGSSVWKCVRCGNVEVNPNGTGRSVVK